MAGLLTFSLSPQGLKKETAFRILKGRKGEKMNKVNALFDEIREKCDLKLEESIQNNDEKEIEKFEYYKLLLNDTYCFVQFDVIVGASILMDLGYDLDTAIEYYNYLGDLDNRFK